MDERADGMDDEERGMLAQTEQWSASLEAMTESQMGSSQVGELVRPLFTRSYGKEGARDCSTERLRR